jgi:hypothetical protein
MGSIGADAMIVVGCAVNDVILCREDGGVEESAEEIANSLYSLARHGRAGDQVRLSCCSGEVLPFATILSPDLNRLIHTFTFLHTSPVRVKLESAAHQLYRCF